MTEALIDIRHLQVGFQTYAGKVQAVRGVSFSLYPGEIVALVGESGCGKTVTAHSILGLIDTPPGHIESGEILFQGRDLLQLTEKEMQKVRGNAISMIFQDPMTSLNPTMRIGHQIIEGLRRHCQMTQEEAKRTTIELLGSVGIPQPETRIDQYPHEFSGGMRQRAMIAMALACNPDLLIADEPTTALDVTIQAQILDLMQRLNRERGTSVLLITHDMSIVAGTCSRVIVMYGGQIVEMGPVDDIFYAPQHPYTRALLHAIPSVDKNDTLTPIWGNPPDLLSPPKGCPFAARCPQAMKVCESHPPHLEETSPQHYSACWMNHPHARQASSKPREVPLNV